MHGVMAGLWIYWRRKGIIIDLGKIGAFPSCQLTVSERKLLATS